MRPAIRAAVLGLCVAVVTACAPDAGDSSKPPRGSGQGLRSSRDLAMGENGRSGTERDAGRSGSVSEQVVLAGDASTGGDGGSACAVCDTGFCGPEEDLCYEEDSWQACECAELCRLRCYDMLGGCGYDPEELAEYIDYLEADLEDVACL